MLLASWRRHLAAENKSPKTLETYTEAMTLFGRFLAEHGMPSDPTAIGREHVEEFITHLLARYKPATAANRYRALGTFFRRLVEEGEIAVSPMAKMRSPTVPEEPPAVLTDVQLGRLLKTCSGSEYPDRRDLAIVLLLLDTGLRLGELAGLAVEDLDLDLNVARVLGKGGDPAPARLERRRRGRLTATSEPVHATGAPTGRNSGSADDRQRYLPNDP
jgi:site-specific recombinase XerD